MTSFYTHSIYCFIIILFFRFNVQIYIFTASLGEYEEYEGPRDYESTVSAILERLDQKYVYYNAKEPDEDGGGTNLEEKKEPEPVEGYRMVSKYKIATL